MQRAYRDTPYTSANTMDSTATLLVFLAPSGREKLFTEGTEMENIHGSPLPPEKVKELYAKYDTEPIQRACPPRTQADRLTGAPVFELRPDISMKPGVLRKSLECLFS